MNKAKPVEQLDVILYRDIDNNARIALPREDWKLPPQAEVVLFCKMDRVKVQKLLYSTKDRVHEALDTIVPNYKNKFD